MVLVGQLCCLGANDDNTNGGMLDFNEDDDQLIDASWPLEHAARKGMWMGTRKRKRKGACLRERMLCLVRAGVAWTHEEVSARSAAR